MAKIPATTAAAMFEEIIGWPYVSPGSNDQQGIDCSGAWVRVFRKHDKSIYHGSNRQYREYCSRTGTITGPGDLRVGMAVFKCRPWDAKNPDDVKHRDYGKAPGNLYHVGCVTSVNPLRIVHATPPVAKVDTTIGTGARRWQYLGLFKEVEYTDAVTSASESPQDDLGSHTPTGAVPAIPAAMEPGKAQVVTTSSGLRLRKLPSTDGERIKEMPIGAIVDVLRVEGMWAQVRYVAKDGTPHVGWCCTGQDGTDYLKFG